MTWPQYVIAAWLAFGTISSFRDSYRDSSLSSSKVLGMWLFAASCTVLIAVTLSCGGFW